MCALISFFGVIFNYGTPEDFTLSLSITATITSLITLEKLRCTHSRFLVTYATLLSFSFDIFLSLGSNSGQVFGLYCCCVYFKFCPALPPGALIITNILVSSNGDSRSFDTQAQCQCVHMHKPRAIRLGLKSGIMDPKVELRLAMYVALTAHDCAQRFVLD